MFRPALENEKKGGGGGGGVRGGRGWITRERGRGRRGRDKKGG